MAAKDTFFYTKNTLNIKGKLFDLGTPKVMGVLNLTPDSFYDGGRLKSDKDILSKAEQMLDEGVNFLDLGGYSSRPGADHISEEEEQKRVLQGLSVVKKKFAQAIVSVDTFRSGIAEKVLEEGADIINDISGGELDKEMYDVISKFKVPYIMMHMRGTPQNMKNQTKYDDLINEILIFFVKKIEELRKRGVNDIILDPGIGFAKSITQNYELLKKLDYFKVFNLPILVGVSRKSFIYKTLGITPDNALNGTTALNTVSLLNGASILRVHDVKEANETIKLLKQL